MFKARWPILLVPIFLLNLTVHISSSRKDDDYTIRPCASNRLAGPCTETHPPHSPRNLFVKRQHQTAIPSPKLVFAHFIAGLTINYTRDDWINQINQAAFHGIDAFAMNVGAPAQWQVDQVSAAYDVAKNINATSGAPFKIFLSLDMSVIQTATEVTAWVTKFTPMASQLLVGGRALISTFSGEDNTLGGSTLSAGWQAAVKDPLAALQPPVNPLFIPVWSSLSPETAVSNNPVVDGIMTWKSWPTGNSSTSAGVDLQFQQDALRNKKRYMAGVSPCFFTHYSDKNFVFRSDDDLYINRWKDLIAMPTQPDFIQIISWNDYGESHYVGPVAGTPPPGTTWLDGFDHQAWLNMTDYFIKWYKAGSPPAITEDQVYYHYRPHSVSAIASADPLGPPANASVTSDAVYAAAFLAPNSTAKALRISIGGSNHTFNNLAPGSVSTFSAPWSGAGGNVLVDLLDGSGKSLMCQKGQQEINNTIETYNFNYASHLLTKMGKNEAKKSSSSKVNISMLYLILLSKAVLCPSVLGAVI